MIHDGGRVVAQVGFFTPVRAIDDIHVVAFFWVIENGSEIRVKMRHFQIVQVGAVTVRQIVIIKNDFIHEHTANRFPFPDPTAYLIHRLIANLHPVVRRVMHDIQARHLLPVAFLILRFEPERGVEIADRALGGETCTAGNPRAKVRITKFPMAIPAHVPTPVGVPVMSGGFPT